jgi:hypothetical protein
MLHIYFGEIPRPVSLVEGFIAGITFLAFIFFPILGITNRAVSFILTDK